MATAEQKIRDAIYRIGRLARYCDRLEESPKGLDSPSVRKHVGVFYLIKEGASVLICDPRIPEVSHWAKHPPVLLLPEEGLQHLAVFEADLTAVAMERARQEAVEALARRTLRRVTRPKTRGFKADMKRKKKPTS